MLCYTTAMNIAFTGHRDKTAPPADLEMIYAQYPNATWIHGGAMGFDSQVSLFAATHNIPQIMIRPDYGAHSKSAPLVRNRQIVDQGDLLVACYDGRKSGGTFYTVRYAQKRIPVHILRPVQNQKEELVAAASR